MRTYLVECYLPAFTGDQLELLTTRAGAAVMSMQARGIQVRQLGYTFLPEEETVFCLIEATSIETVEELSRRASIPTARIVEAQHVPRS